MYMESDLNLWNHSTATSTATMIFHWYHSKTDILQWHCLLSHLHDIIDNNDWVSIGDNGSDTNSLEEAFSHSESTSSVTTLPVQWELSEDNHKWQASAPGLEQDGHFVGTDALYWFSDH